MVGWLEAKYHRDCVEHKGLHAATTHGNTRGIVKEMGFEPARGTAKPCMEASDIKAKGYGSAAE